MSTLKRMQKLFAVLLVFTFVAGIVAVPGSAYAAKREPMRNLDINVDKLVEDIDDEDVKDAVLRLNAFGIVEGMGEDGKYHAESKLTREQFAKMLVTALKMDHAAKAGVGYKSFPDVPADRWSSGFVGVAAGQGLVQGYPDGTFKPTKEVSYAEAVTMLVRALGYKDEFLPGAWPGNYLAKGAEADVTKKVRFSDAAGIVNRGDAALMVNNTLDAKVVKVDTYEGAIVKYYESEKTLLEDKFDIIKAEDARIVATKRVDDGLKWDQVTVYFTKDVKEADKRDKVIFSEGKDKNFDVIEGYNPEFVLGEEATVYINDDDEVVYAESENDDKVYFDYVEEIKGNKKDRLSLVKFDDDYPFAEDAYVYMKDGDKVRPITIEEDTDYYKFTGKVGKFVVSNNEIVWAEIIESTEADPWFIVMKNNDGLLTGICADNEEHDVDLREDEDYDGVIVLDINGDEMEVEDIEEGNLLYVQKQELDSDDYAVVRVVQDNIIEGKLDKVENKKIHLDGEGIKVVHYEGKDNTEWKAYYSIDDGDDIKVYDLEKDTEVADDMEDADEEDIVAYTDAVGRIAYFVTKASATSGYKYGVVTKKYVDGDRIKVYVVDNEGEGDEIVYTMEEDDNLEKNGAFALNEFGQKLDKYGENLNRATVDNGSIIKFKLNRDGEIAEDKIYVLDPKHVWSINSKDDFGKDYLPTAKLYKEEDYEIVTVNEDNPAGLKVADNSDPEKTATFSADDKTKIIDAETYKFTSKWNPKYKSGDFDPAKWKDLKDANGIDGFFYVFADDDNEYDAKAVIFIGDGSGAASDDEIGIYVIKEWYKGGDRYVKYHEYDGEVLEKELDDEDDLYAGKEYPYIAKVKSNDKLEIINPYDAEDFTVYFGEIKDKDSSRMTMKKVFEVNKKGSGKNAFDGDGVYEEASQKKFNISNKTVVYEEDDKKTTSSLKGGDLVIFVAEKGSNVRVIEKLKKGESDYKDVAEKVEKEDPEDPTPTPKDGKVTYKDATNKVVYVDNTPYVLGASTILKTAKGSIIAVGDSAILTALAENDEVTGIDIKDGVVTSLVATKIASVQTTAVTYLIATLDSNELNPAHADFNKDGNNVSNARSAYDALTPAQRDFVTNYDKLVAAEAALAAAAKEADEAAVAAAKEAVTLGDTSAVIADLTLPTAPAGVTFTWESSNTTVLGNDGKVTRPAYVDGDATVTLTVTITKGDVSDTKEFTVVVKAESVVKAVNDAADATAMRAALQDLVDNGDFDAASTEKWNSLVGSQKDTVAGDVLTAKGAGFADLAALQAAFTTALGL